MIDSALPDLDQVYKDLLFYTEFTTLLPTGAAKRTRPAEDPRIMALEAEVRKLAAAAPAPAPPSPQLTPPPPPPPLADESSGAFPASGTLGGARGGEKTVNFPLKNLEKACALGVFGPGVVLPPCIVNPARLQPPAGDRSYHESEKRGDGRYAPCPLCASEYDENIEVVTYFKYTTSNGGRFPKPPANVCITHYCEYCPRAPSKIKAFQASHPDVDHTDLLLIYSIDEWKAKLEAARVQARGAA